MEKIVKYLDVRLQQSGDDGSHPDDSSISLSRNGLALRPLRECGFTLCEVMIALGIFVFALVALLGLMPVALSSSRESLDIALMTQLADGVAAQLRRDSFSTLAANGGIQSLYFDDLGNALSNSEGAVYHAKRRLNSFDSDNLLRAEISVERVTMPGRAKHFCYLIFNNA